MALVLASMGFAASMVGLLRYCIRIRRRHQKMMILTVFVFHLHPKGLAQLASPEFNNSFGPDTMGKIRDREAVPFLHESVQRLSGLARHGGKRQH